MDDLEYNELINKGRSFAQTSDWDQAIDCYNKAFSIMIKTDDLLDLSIIYLENDNSFKASAGIEAVIKAQPDNFKGYFYKGVYLEHLDKDLEALGSYLKALELEKNEAEIYFKIGRIYDDLSDECDDNTDVNNYAKENLDQAIYYYKEALKINDKHYYANLNLGSIYEKFDENEDALRLTLIAHDNNKDEKMSSYNLGVIYSKLENYDEAIKCYNEEVTKKDFYPYAYYNLGLIYKDQYHNINKSIECYLLGLKYLPKEANLWYNLGCCHVLNNDYKNASDCFYCAVTLNSLILDFIQDDKEVASYANSLEYIELRKKFNK